MPATALPMAGLGPAGLQAVAHLAAAHSGRPVQMRAGVSHAQGRSERRKQNSSDLSTLVEMRNS